MSLMMVLASLGNVPVVASSVFDHHDHSDLAHVLAGKPASHDHGHAHDDLDQLAADAGQCASENCEAPDSSETGGSTHTHLCSAQTATLPALDCRELVLSSEHADHFDSGGAVAAGTLYYPLLRPPRA